MKNNQKKILRITLVFLLLFLLSVQGLKSKEIIKERELLQLEILELQKQNKKLEDEYSTYLNNNNLSSNNQRLNLKEITAETLDRLKQYELQLIDFSSTEAELNLNLSGDFNSILKFIYYLENEIKILKIEEFKIKENQDNLFFFVKLKKELI